MISPITKKIIKSKILLSLFFFLITSLLFNMPGQNIQNTDSLISITKMPDNISKVDKLIKKCQNLESSDIDKCIELSTQAINMSFNLNYDNGVNKSILLLNKYYDISGKTGDIIPLFEKTLSYFKKKNNLSNIASTLNALGMVYRKLGKPEKAIENTISSLKYSEKLKDSTGISQSLNNLGIIYLYSGDFTQSIKYYSQSKEIKMKRKDTLGVANTNLNIGMALMSSMKYKEANEYLKEALSLYRKKNDKFGIAQALNNLGVDYDNLGDSKKAMEYYISSMKMYEELNLKEKVAVSLNNIGENYFYQKQYTTALSYLMKSLQLSKELQYNDLTIHTYMIISKLFAEQRNFENAYNYYTKQSILKDSLFNMQSVKSIQELQTKYETEKKQKQIELQSAEISKKEIEAKRRDFQRNVLITGIILLIFFGLYIYRSLLQKKKANQILKEKNIEISQQKEEIQTQAEQLEIINKELEKLSIVASETDNAVVIADINGEIEWVNNGFTRLYGFTLDSFISEKGSNIIANSTNPQNTINCLQHKKSISYESKFLDKKGDQLWIQTTLTAITDNNDKIVKLIAIDTDITPIKKIEEQLEKQNTQILDSISFAKLLQDAILPTKEMIQNIIPESFIFFKPKDIVSGDFYWLHNEDNKILIALADCTGHGVSGAFMSMIGNALLNEIVKGKKIYNPTSILNTLNIEVNALLNQSGQNYDAGMDITICCIDKKTNLVTIGLAGQTAYCIQNGELIELNSGFATIGGNISLRSQNKYKEHLISINDGFILYMASDGYTDQFGGSKNIKFNSTRFKQMLSEIAGKDMKNQEDTIVSNFNEWRGNMKQLDDVTVVGIQIN